VLRGHVPAAVAGLQPVNRLDATTNLHLAIGLPMRNKSALTNLIEDLYNPASPNYHHYLTTAQFTDQFGPTPEDCQKVMDYLQSRGLKVTGTYSNRMVLDVDGAAADVEQAFHVRLQVYRHPTEPRNFFSPDQEPSVDTDVPVLAVMGLDNYIVPHPMDLRRKKPGVPTGSGITPYAEIGSGANGSFIGNDFRTAYVPGVTNTGTGQYIGLMEFGPYYTNDITTYEIAAGRSTNIVVSNIFLNGVTLPPANGTDAGEQALDIEMCIAMAPGATVLYYGGNSVDSILGRIASDNLAKQISCSFGFGIDATTEQLYQEFVAQGQNYFQASGDAGAYVGTINPPAAEPYVTIVGGTALYTVTPGGAWQKELTWVGSGGGVSTFYAIPNYQQGINMAPLQGSSTMRNFPDVSMMADTVIFLAANNGTGEVGGTSCSSPLWAAFYSLANEQAATLGQPPIGFFNPVLYALGKSTNYTNCFHDITSGNTTNYNSGPTKFFAATGYDLATGWGSPTGSNLINALTTVGTNNFFLYASPITLNLSIGGSDTVLVSEQPMNGFSGTVNLSVSNLPTGVTASFSPAATTSTSVLTLTAGGTAAAGTNTLTLTGVSGSITQTVALTLTVGAATPGTSQVSLSSAFNLTAIYNNGSTFSGGADGGGNAYSSSLLGSALNWNGCLFTRGAANANDVVKCSHQSIALPSGNFSSLQILATAVGGTQTAQPFVVNYTDGTSNIFTQSLSDWTSPLNYPGETIVVPEAYRLTGSGGTDTVTRACLYGYSFGLNNTKTVKNIKLPNDSDVLVFAMTLANDFTLYGSPPSIVLTAGGKSTSYLISSPTNGLSGSVALSATGLPAGVTASFSPAASTTSSILTLTAAATAQPVNTVVVISGTLNGITHNLTPNFSVITPITGATPVSLTSAFNATGFYNDGVAFSALGGFDGAGNAYSANLLGSAPNWNGSLFNLGTSGALNVVRCSGQSIALPAGQYTGLLLLGAATNASQPNQVFQVSYTDGTFVTVTQSISVWTAAQNYAGESVAISAAYSDTSAGTESTAAPVNVYGYVLPLNDSKTVQSVTLPNNTHVTLLAMTLANVPAQVSLTSAFNSIGIYTDGTTYGGGSGLDNSAYAYSGTLLGTAPIWDSEAFNLAPANSSNTIECAGQNIALPTNRYTTLLLLAAAANGAQTSQPFTVNYTDGTTTPIVQSISDWVNVTAYSNQFTAVSMPYRNLSSGGADSSVTHVFGYLFGLNNTKTVQSFKLPTNSNVQVLALNLNNAPLPVSLLSNYNRAGIYTDGTSFTGAGLDNDGNALSATLLGPTLTWHNSFFEFGLANQTNVVSAAGQTIPLPPGQYSALLMLATSVNGSQSSQVFTVHYTNGTSTTLTATMSDWANPQNFTGESTVVAMGYRDGGNGGQNGPAVNLYGYSFSLNSNNVVQSVTLPNNNNVEVLALTLSNYTAALPEAPGITTEPTPSLIVTNGKPANLSVVAYGSPALAYQWRKNGANLSNGGNVSGATTNSLTLSTTTTNDSANYTVVITNAYGSVTSSVAALNVVLPPAITNQPQSLTVTNGSPAMFSVTATGTPVLYYQWEKNGTNLTDGGNISGSLSNLLLLSATSVSDAANYTVIITNAYGSVTSSVAVLTVILPPPAFQTVTANNGAIQFSWSAVAGQSYQLQYNTDLTTTNWINLGAPITATNGVITMSDLTSVDPQRFYQVILLP